MVKRQRARKVKATNVSKVMKTIAEGCARSCAPIIWMAETKDGRMTITILVLQKGIQGLPDFAGGISSRGQKSAVIRLKFQAFKAKPPLSMTTQVFHILMQIHAVVCIDFSFFPANFTSLLQNFPLPFLYCSPATLWLLGQSLSPVSAIPSDFMARLAEGRVQARSKWAVEPRARCDVFDSLSHALSTGPSCLSHNPSTYFWSQ